MIFSRLRDTYNRWPLLYIAAVTMLLAIAALLIARLGYVWVGDMKFYRHYSELMWDSQLPYRDFSLEYPPGVLPFFLLARLLGSATGDYFAGFIGLTSLSVIIFFWSRLRAKFRGIAWTILAILPILQFVFFQIDTFVAITLYGSLLCVLQKRYSLSAILFGFACLIKGYPLICLPILLLILPRSHIKKYILVLAGVLVVGLLPFFLLSPSGFVAAFQYHSGRPLEIGSGPASIGFILHLFGEPITRSFTHASWALRFPAETIVEAVSTTLLLGGAGWIYIKAFLNKQRLNPMTTILALLILFVLTFKVGSPQFIVPVIFVAALAAGEMSPRDRVKLYIRLFIISVVLFIRHTWDPYSGFLPGYLGYAMVLRTLLIIELLVWTLRRMLKPLPQPALKLKQSLLSTKR